MAGVSRTTVSFVLNHLEGVRISSRTRERVLRAARKLDYHPNAAGLRLVRGKSDTLGLVLCQSPEQVVADAFLPRVILGIEQAALQYGFHVLLKPVEPGDPLGYTRLIHENHVDGIILSGPRQDDQEIRRLHMDGVPIVLLGQLPESSLRFVDVDAETGAECAVDHLLELGHTRIGMITNAPLSYVSAHQRKAGFLRAFEARGMTPDTRLIREGNYTPASGYQAMQALLAEQPRPSAVFVASDVVAMGAMLAAKRMGLRIPADLAIAGFDDVPTAEFFDPPLTTVRLPAFDLGWSAGDRLIRLIRGDHVQELGTLLDSALIIRESTRMK